MTRWCFYSKCVCCFAEQGRLLQREASGSSQMMSNSLMFLKVQVGVPGNLGLPIPVITNQISLVNITYVHENYSYSESPS